MGKFWNKVKMAIDDFTVRWGFGREEYKKAPYTNLCGPLDYDQAFKEYAIQLCINRLAMAFTMTDFNVFKKNERNKQKLEHMLNVQPNVNQNKYEFYHKLIDRAIFCPGGALVINEKDNLVVADSYNVEEFALYPNIYKDIQVGNFKMNAIYDETKVLRFNLDNARIKAIIDNVYNHEGKLIKGAIRQYNKSNAEKIFLELPTNFEQFQEVSYFNEETQTMETKTIDVMEDFLNNAMKAHMSESDSVTPLQDGMKISQNDHGRQVSTKGSTKDTRDIINLFNNIIEMVSGAFNMAPAFVMGNVAESQNLINNTISFGINPPVKSWETEVNRKMFTVADYSAGTRVYADTSKVKTTDPITMAAGLEALTRVSAINTNDIRELINKPPVKEKWADEFVLTKNYDTRKEGSQSDTTNTEIGSNQQQNNTKNGAN